MPTSSKPILIACPEFNKLVRGVYHCNEQGRMARGRDGGFLLRLVECSQMEGRCAQTLCALHRYNRGGPQTWVPDRIFAMPDRARRVGTAAALCRRRRSREPDLF
ncbi:MAG: hypothetical protein ACLFV7_11135 [Phycisphaerae bacterium]